MIKKIELLDQLKQTGIQPGETVMVHSSYKSLGGVEDGAQGVLDTLIGLVGDEGTLLLPTFNFQSWTENHYFDILETPSHMGILTELGRQMPEAGRTSHPIYSFVAIGKNAEDYGVCHDREAYGPNSVFAKFHQENGTILSLGLHFNSTFSMHHYIEYNVGCDYRRVKEFSGIYVGYDRVPRMETYTMFVRRSNLIETDIVRGMTDLVENGTIQVGSVGNAIIYWSKAVDFYDNMATIVRDEPEKLHNVKLIG